LCRDAGALDDVRQLPNVPRPVIVRQRLQGRWRHRLEIAPEALVGNHRRQIPVRGGDQAHSHPNRLRAPQPLERLLLQDPQEFGLEIQRNVADLVEKERATDSRARIGRRGGPAQWQAMTHKLLSNNAVSPSDWNREPLRRPAADRGSAHGGRAPAGPARAAGAIDKRRFKSWCASHQSRSRSAPGILAAPCHEPGPTQHLNRKP